MKKNYFLIILISLSINAQNKFSDFHLNYDSIVNHTVQKKETIFSLSKKYGLSINEIIKANPGIQIDKLKRIFETTYKHHLDKDLIHFQPKALVLSSADIHHYVDSIKDSMSDPIYSEKPRSLTDIVNEPAPTTLDEPKKPVNDKSLSMYYLSSLFHQSLSIPEYL